MCTPQAVVSPGGMRQDEGRDTFVVQCLSKRNDCSQGNVLEWSPLSNRGSFHKDLQTVLTAETLITCH